MTTSDQLEQYEAKLRARTCAACLVLFANAGEKRKHDRAAHSPHPCPAAYHGRLLNPMSERFEAKP